MVHHVWTEEELALVKKAAENGIPVSHVKKRLDASLTDNVIRYKENAFKSEHLAQNPISMKTSGAGGKSGVSLVFPSPACPEISLVHSERAVEDKALSRPEVAASKEDEEEGC